MNEIWWNPMSYMISYISGMSAIDGMFPPSSDFLATQHVSMLSFQPQMKVFGVVLRSLGIAKANWHWAVSNIFKRLQSMKSYEILIGMERILPWNNPQMVLTSIAKYSNKRGQLVTAGSGIQCRWSARCQKSSLKRLETRQLKGGLVWV